VKRVHVKLAALALVLTASAGLAACGKKTPPPPPAPPPAAPPTPTPAPPPPAPEPPPQLNEYDRLKQMSLEELDRQGLLPEIRFDYDKADVREGDRAILERNAATLKKFDFLKVKVEGHCDERGTVEYNLALGERRAKAAYDYLVSLGVPASRLQLVSFGKEMPVCQESSEDCWQKNRRARFTVTGK
jgi:peptidoglycan-associated lipoprotein